MAIYKGWVIKKEYFLIEVEANSWEEAREKAWDADLDDEPVDIDWEIYDIEEIKETENA
jgi:hypothetical protein